MTQLLSVGGMRDARQYLLVMTWGIALAWVGLLLLGAWHAPMFMDEYSFLRNVAHFAQQRTLVPVYTRYPTLYSYLIAGPAYLAYLAAYVARGYPWAGIHDASFLRFFFAENKMVGIWAARVVTMLFSAGTVVLMGRELCKTGSLPALLIGLAILVLDSTGVFRHLSSHGLADVPMTFLATAAMLLIWRAVALGSLKVLCYGAFLSGLSASCKLNGTMLVFPLLVAARQIGRRSGGVGRIVAGSCAWFVVGFFLGSPFLLLAPQSYWPGLSVEKGVLLGAGHLGSHAPNWIWLPELLWKSDPLALIVAGVTVGSCFFRRREEDLLFLALVIPSFLVLGALSKKTLWYFVFLYPLFGLYAGRFVLGLYNRVSTPLLRRVLVLVLVALLIGPALNLKAWAVAGLRPDNRTLARQWIEANLSSGAVVAVDWAYVPELQDEAEISKKIRTAQEAGSKFVALMSVHYRQRPAYRLVRLQDIGYTWNAVEQAAPDYLVTSSWCYRRFFPENASAVPPADSPLRPRFEATRAFYEALLKQKTPFRLRAHFDDGSGPDVELYYRGIGP